MDAYLTNSMLKKVEIQLEVYSDLIKDLEEKKHELYRKQNYLLRELKKQEEK